MVRLSVETVNDASQFINAVQQRELSLRNLQIPAIENLGVTKDQFDVIDLTDNNIRKIENLPLLNRLETFLLHNNRIQQIQKDIGEKLPHLKTLALTNNNISELGDIAPLSNCPKLEYLSLMGNPITHKPHYRAYVIAKLPKLRVLDFRRIKDVERTASKQLFKTDEGKKLEEQLGHLTSQFNGEEPERRQNGHGRSEDELSKIREAIKKAKTLAEVEHLTSILHTGHVPGVEKPIEDDAEGDENDPMEA